MALIINGEKIEDFVIKQEIERLRPEYEKTFAYIVPNKRDAQLAELSKEMSLQEYYLPKKQRIPFLKCQKQKLDLFSPT